MDAIELEGVATWKLETTLKDAEDWIQQASERKREMLERVLDRVKQAMTSNG